MTPSSDASKPRLTERLSGALLKPAKETTETPSDEGRSVSVLEKEVRAADDKERAVGLFLAPFAAVIALLINATLINHDPAAKLSGGAVNPAHVSVSLYDDVLFALLGLSIAMLVTAWLRKRVFLGIIMGMFGLTVFNLHYWGFGVPYLLCAGWLLVRAYRLQKELREAALAIEGTAAAAAPGRPRANKRYTPRTATGSRV